MAHGATGDARRAKKRQSSTANGQKGALGAARSWWGTEQAEAEQGT
jgi:hypothetical protein